MKLMLSVIAVLLLTIACNDDSEGTSTTAATPTETALAVADTRYIRGTPDEGVSVRTACQDTASTDAVLAGGTAVRVTQLGTGDCEGWTFVLAGATGSWVRTDDLVGAASTAGGSPTPSSTEVAVSTGAPGTVSTAAPGSTPVRPTVPTTTAPPATPTPRPGFDFVAATGETLNTRDLEGVAFLQGGASGFDYLGLISISRSNERSICNPSGAYGSTSAVNSIRNPNGPIGTLGAGAVHDPYFNSAYSAYNLNATSPPKLVYDGSVVAYVTKRTAIGSSIIDPDQLLQVLGCPR